MGEVKMRVCYFQSLQPLVKAGVPVTGGAQLTDGQSGLVLRGVGVVLGGVAHHISPYFFCGGREGRNLLGRNILEFSEEID